MFHVHRLTDGERGTRVGPQERIFPKMTKCDWFYHSGIGQVDVSVNLEENFPELYEISEGGFRVSPFVQLHIREALSGQ